MKIGDVVYLTEPFKWWAEKDKWNEEKVYPAGTPCRIIGDSGYRGWDLEIIENGVKILESRFVPFTNIKPIKE